MSVSESHDFNLNNLRTILNLKKKVTMEKCKGTFWSITNVLEKYLDLDYCNMGSSFPALHNLRNHKIVAPNLLLHMI